MNLLDPGKGTLGLGSNRWVLLLLVLGEQSGCRVQDKAKTRRSELVVVSRKTQVRIYGFPLSSFAFFGCFFSSSSDFGFQRPENGHSFTRTNITMDISSIFTMPGASFSKGDKEYSSPGATEDRLCRMGINTVEAQWAPVGVIIRKGVSSSVVLVTWLSFSMMRPVTNSPRVGLSGTLS
ncbi:hypothetical protein TNCV_2155611 [Trichonephila clavipes]|nr:hypothetical protein TNCV_2155611 [Trichonephila clavipes]